MTEVSNSSAAARYGCGEVYRKAKSWDKIKWNGNCVVELPDLSCHLIWIGPICWGKDKTIAADTERGEQQKLVGVQGELG